MSKIDRKVDRRGFLRGAIATSGGAILAPTFLQGLAARLAHAGESSMLLSQAGKGEGGYGSLQPTPDLNDGVIRLALPLGFSYVTFGIEGTTMSDGNLTPKAHDGMAAFRLPNGNVRLIRNHEDRDGPTISTLKGEPTTAYDPLGGGSCTSLEVEVTADGVRQLVRDFISINGTFTNCSGGPTPWGSWLTCEETTAGTTAGWTKPHGYVFEVPVSAEDEVQAIPYPALGRFSHEAVAVDPYSWIVYQTEDSNPCGLYRFLANQPGKLIEGGLLQVLAVKERPGYDTRHDQKIDRPLLVEWVDIPITVSPRGGLLVCEDGELDNQYLRGLTIDGRIFNFAQFLLNNREWAGATYSPDGQTLFVNIQGDTRSGEDGNLGYTFAIWGPWEAGIL